MKQVLATILLVVATAGCIHKQAGPVSPWERFNVNLAALAEINSEVAAGVIAVQRSGGISVQQASPILNYQELVAKDHSAIENILAAGDTSDQNERIRGLLSEIKNQGSALLQTGGLGIKNPKSQETFGQDLQAIVNLAEVIIANYEMARGK